MIAVALSIALQHTAPTPQPWRLVNLPWLHIGLRPAVAISRDEVAMGATIQVTL